VKVAGAFALIVLFLVGVVLAVYLTQVPGMVTDDYRDEARPEQLKLRKALRPVYGTFTAFTFGIDDTAIDKAKNERQFVKAVEKVSREALRELRPTRRAIEKARRALERADEGKLFDVDVPPLVSDGGEIGDAKAIAADERRYLSRARSFLKDYDRLVAFEIKGVEFLRDSGVTVARGFDKIPQTFTSPGQFTRPVEGVIKTLGRDLRRFRKRRAPPDLAAEHREAVRDTEFLIARLRDMNAAARNLDNAALQRAYRRLKPNDEKLDREARKALRRFLTKSRTAKQIRELRKRERELSAAFAEL
jgi:hypothetical protein